MCKTENQVQDIILNFTFVQNLKFWFKLIINLFKYKEFILYGIANVKIKRQCIQHVVSAKVINGS